LFNSIRVLAPLAHDQIGIDDFALPKSDAAHRFECGIGVRDQTNVDSVSNLFHRFFQTWRLPIILRDPIRNPVQQTSTRSVLTPQLMHAEDDRL